MADLQAIRDYASSLQGDDRQNFIDKFNSIKEDDTKVATLASRISEIQPSATPKEAPTTPMYPQMSEQDKVAHPILSGINQAGNNLATLAYKGAEGLTLGGGFGLVDSLLKKQGISKPQFNFDNMPQQDQSVMKLAGDVANLGGAGKTLGAIGGKIGDVLNSTGATKAIGGAIGAAKNYVVDAFTGGEKAKSAGEAAKFALRQDTAAQAQGIVKNTMMQSNIQKASQDAIGKGYDDLSTTLKKMITKESDKQGLALQEDLPKLFGKKSAEYGAQHDAIISSLPEDQRVISSDKVVQIIR